MADQPRKTVDSYIAALEPELRATAQALRTAILAAEPKAKESIKWGQPVYEISGPFVALKAFPRWVTLTFWRGAALANSHPMLLGEGDRMRHIRFTSPDSIDGEEPPAPERAVPALASGDAPVMIIVAIGVALVAAWEILDGFRQAHRQRALPQAVGT